MNRGELSKGVGLDSVNWRALRRLTTNRTVESTQDALSTREQWRTEDQQKAVEHAIYVSEKAKRHEHNISIASGSIHTANGRRVYIGGRPR